MSSYEIDYGMLDGDAKRASAIEDIKGYLGEERYLVITAELTKAISEGATLEDLRFPLAFAGVRGYPVTAWYETIIAGLDKQG